MLAFATAARKMQWTHMEAFISWLCLINQICKIITINTKQTNYFRVVLQESHTGGKINDNIYIHCSTSADHGFGCSWTFLVGTIQVYPSARLLVYWICSCLGGRGWVAWVEGAERPGWRRGTSLFRMISHRAELSRDLQFTSFLGMAY